MFQPIYINANLLNVGVLKEDVLSHRIAGLVADKGDPKRDKTATHYPQQARQQGNSDESRTERHCGNKREHNRSSQSWTHHLKQER